MKKLTSSIYTFEKLIEQNCLYVDKTEYIWQLLEQPYGTFFLSRPRRFGKSLTLSTLKAVFQGKKHLFKGLVLESKSYDWKEYPVIHIDLGDRPCQDGKQLNNSLCTAIDESAATLDITLTATNAAERFRELVLKASTVEKIVILIDEYDKPILDNATASNIEEIRRVLEDFYSVVKGTEPFQRFVLLTGVSKFSKVSVFSKLNNLTDISMDAKYATMLGYTQEELEHDFPDYIERTVELLQTTRSDLLQQMKLWYNGYRFHSNAPTVYNPVSIAKFFESNGEFQNFWFETGTPGFLLKVAREQQFNFEDALSRPVSRLAFSAYEIGKLKTLPLLYQTGYLTIADTVKDQFETFYRLGFPNREVESAFDAYLIDEYAGVDKEDVAVIVAELDKFIRQCDIDSFMSRLQIFFAGIPYDIQLAHEKYYQSIFYIVFRLLNLRIEAEARTNIGRIDAVVQTDKYVYIFEFKLDGSAEEALRQIRDKSYYEKFLASGKEIILVGANFSTEKRGVENWLSESVAR